MTATDSRACRDQAHGAVAGRRWTTVQAFCLLVLVFGTPVASAQGNAQQLPLKRTLPNEAARGCSSTPKAAQVSPRQREEARRLSALGHEAAITGDNRAARDLFRQAARMDPTNEEIAYHLARASEAVGDASEAVRAYCLYLTLAKSASDTAEVRKRIVQLSPRQTGTPSSRAASFFRAGLEHFDRGNGRDAEYAFSNALSHAPDWAEAYYNRALVHAALGDRGLARQDFQTYLQLRPQAADREVVLQQIARLRGRIPDPAGAFARGFILPGLGQYYTGRPALGLAVLGGVAFAGIVAVQSKDDFRVFKFDDDFGNPREDRIPVKKYPYFVAGVATAAAITVGAALEAYLYAQRVRDRDAAPSADGAPARNARGPDLPTPLVAPSAGGTRLGISIRF